MSDPKIDNAMSLKFLSSFLDDVSNKNFLSFLSYFGSTKILKQTSKEELLQIEGVNKLLAQIIIDKINNE